MNKLPKVSVIMSVYNENNNELNTSINSILNQTYNNFEYIIVDDNPRSKRIRNYLLKKRNKDSRVRLIFNHVNLGISKSFNNAIVHANGKYIVRLDADDKAKKYRIKSEISFLIYHNLDLVSSNLSMVNDDGQLVKRYALSKKTQTNQKLIKNVLKRCNITMGSMLCFKKNAFIAVHGFRDTNVEDYDLATRLLSHGYRVGYLAKPLMICRFRTGSLSYKTSLSQYVIIRTIGRFVTKFNYKKVTPLELIYKNVNNISNKQIKHFNYFSKQKYNFYNDKNFINLILLIKSIIFSKIVFDKCIWSLFINRHQEKYM